jgi:cytochrome c oxidase subunit 2
MFNNFPLWPVAASANAEQVETLYIFLVLLCGMICVAIFSVIFIFAVKYRHTKVSHANQIEGSNLLEFAWTVVPAFIFLFIFYWGVVIYFHQRTPPLNSLDVYVVSKQWMWKLQHVGGQREINELHIPANRDVRLLLTSQDVIHDFFVPEFRIKADVVPGRYNTTWFRANRPGIYHLFCAEYCGTLHSGMIGRIVVMEPAQYASWLNGLSTSGSLAQTGESLFQQLGCNTCHRSDAQGRGPNLVGLYGQRVPLQDSRTIIADESYIRESILDPPAKVVSGFEPIMPTFPGLGDDDVNALVEYVKSLSHHPTDSQANSLSGPEAKQLEQRLRP